MAQVAGIRHTNQAISETSLIRFVSDEGLLLEPDEQPLITFLLNLKKKKNATSARLEWFEDDYVARWGQNANNAIANTTASTTITVVDGTLFTPGDVVMVPKAAASTTAPELIQVTARTGDVLTITRAFAGSTIDTISASDSLAILGPAYEEGVAPPTAKTTTRVAKVSYTQIFRKTLNHSKTMVASGVYGAPDGERALQHMKLLKQMKIDMNRAFLFGKSSEALSGGPTSSQPIRTTMGLNSVISTNVTNANGTLTRKGFETFARSAFRYGSKKKLLIAAPLVISAIHDWGNMHMQLSPEEKVFGVSINRVVTGHGEWILLRDWMLEDGVSGKNGFASWAFSVDLEDDNVMYCPLVNHGQNRDVQIKEDIIKDGRDAYVDEGLAEVGLIIKHEKKHSKLMNVTDYSA